MSVIQSAISSIRNKASEILNDNQGWFRGGKFTPVQQAQQLQSQSPFGAFGLPNFKNQQVKQIYSSVNTPEKQQQFNQQPVKGFGQNLNSYVMNNYVAPISQVPYQAKQLFGKDKTKLERGFGALGVLGGTLAMIPDPIGDIALPTYNYLKGVTAAQKRGEGTIQSYKTGITSLTGQKPVGLGEALSSDPTKQMIGNIAELPLMFAVTGKIGKTKANRQMILNSAEEVAKYSTLAKNYDRLRPEIQVHVFEKMAELGKKVIPQVVNNKEMKSISLRDPQAWLKYTSNYLDDAVMNARHPELNFGFNTRTIKKSDQSKGVIPEVGGKKISGMVDETPMKTESFKLEKIKGETNDQAVARDIGYQIDNGLIRINEDPVMGGWKAQINGNLIGTEEPLIIRTDNKSQLMDEVFKKIHPDYSVPIKSPSIPEVKKSSFGEMLSKSANKLSKEPDYTKLEEKYLKNKLIGNGQSGMNKVLNDVNSSKNISSDPNYSPFLPEVKGLDLQKQIDNITSDINLTGKQKVDAVKPLTEQLDKLGLPYHSPEYQPEVKTNIPNTQIGKVSSQDGISIPTKQTELPVSNKPLQSQDILPLNQGEIKQQIVKNKAQLKKVLAENPNANVRIELTPNKGQIATLGQVPDRVDVAATLPNRLNNFVEDVLGYSIKNPTGGTKNASLWTRTLRKGQTAITTKVEEGLGSENPYIRNAATGLQNFFRGLGMSPERQAASMELRGEMGVANDRAYNVMDTLYKSLGNNKKSLERINAVLDPEISTTKVTFDQLSKTEKQVYGLIREGFDLVHDTSYANGHISPELYIKNKGKYVPRLYDVTELPAEVNKFVTSGKKITSDLYKQRKNVDTWKQDNSLNDPVYALGKRLSQVQTNSAIKKYTDFLSSNQRFISDVERPGFTKLSDSPAYGNLSGKYVLNSAAEDLKGFFFANQGMQNLYDVFRAYDRMPIRQLQKKLLTVFNPTTNVGNIVSDQVFGWVTGVDPFTLNKNLIKTKGDPALFKQLNDYLTQKGITGTDITRTDFTNKLTSIDELARGKKPGKLKTATGKVQSFYGGTDDSYKVAALQSLLDKGFTLEEATTKVGDGFQNYANVGKFYDLAAKTPIIGKPFMKFQGDLIRIIKNGAVNNPLGLISFLGTLKAISYLSSKASGESDEDRKTRENRFAAPMIPGLNIPLTWQTPIGEINVARYISPFYANNETTNMFSNMIPGVPNIDPNKDVASNIAMNVNDPLVSPLVQLAVNRDFRGKNISDPNENKYQPSTLTSGEKLTNQAIFAGRAYLPPPVNSAIDVPQVALTGKNMYGSPQTVGQSVARLGGIKISDMSAEQVQSIRDKDAIYQQNSNEYLQKQIQSVKKEQLTGGISQDTANNRIANLESQKKEVNQSLIKGSGDEISYINDSGNMATVNLTKLDDIANLPSDNKYNSAIKESKQYATASTIMDNTALTTEQQQTALERLGISSSNSKIDGMDIKTREADNFPFPDYSKSAPGQTLRADLNLSGNGNADIVFHLKTPDGQIIDVPQSSESYSGDNNYYGLEMKIPSNISSGTGEVWVTVNGKEVNGTRKKHEILNTNPVDRYSDNVRQSTPNDPTFTRESISSSGNVTKEKIDYYKVANDSDNLKTMFVMDAINKVKTEGGGFSDVIQLLANQRTEVNSKMIASNGVLDNLVDEGILSKTQATQLKKYKFENGQLTPKSKTGTKAKKAKKISVTLRKMSAPKLSSSRTKVKRISVPKLTYKKTKARKLRVLKLPTITN